MAVGVFAVMSFTSTSFALSSTSSHDNYVQRGFNQIVNELKQEKISDSEVDKYLELNNELKNIGFVDFEQMFQESSKDSFKERSFEYNDLRRGNGIELVLDLDEGLDMKDIAKIGVTIAGKARNEATEKYPDDLMLRDAFRHFTWNYLGANEIGVKKTRTATINHEWGMLILSPVKKYLSETYEDYKKDGYSTKRAKQKAVAKTMRFIPDFKDKTIRICKKNYKFFKGIFSGSNIMDLHNNCYGRAYSKKVKDDYEKAFKKAKSDLILDEDVSNSEYKYLYDSEWYTY